MTHRTATSHEILKPVESPVDLVLRGCKGEPYHLVAAERSPRYNNETLLGEKLVAESEAVLHVHLLVELRHVDEIIEGAAGLGIPDRGYARETIAEEILTPLELHAHHLAILGALLNRFERRPLRNRIRTSGRVRLESAHPVREILLGEGETDSPSRHRIALRDAGDDDGLILDLGDERHGRIVLPSAEGEKFVYLVADERDARFENDLRDRFDLLAPIDDARRVRRRIEKKRLGLLFAGQLFAKYLGRELVIGLSREIHDPGPPAENPDHIRIARPVGGEDEHLVAGIDERKEGVVDRVLRAVRDDDLRRGVLDAELLRVHLGDRLTQGRDPLAGRIFCFSARDRLDSRLFDHVRSVEIRFPGGQSDDVLPLRLELLRLRREAQRDGRLETARALADHFCHFRSSF